MLHNTQQLVERLLLITYFVIISGFGVFLFGKLRYGLKFGFPDVDGVER
jgi:hypothetical protein